MNDRESRGGRKVAVLGPIPRDQVVTPSGDRFEKYGLPVLNEDLVNLPNWLVLQHGKHQPTVRHHSSEV
jgi:hypothetical protein